MRQVAENVGFSTCTALYWRFEAGVDETFEDHIANSSLFYGAETNSA
jgi:hypothetical protein